MGKKFEILADTQTIADFMSAVGQPVHDSLRGDVPSFQERKLRAKLVLEEAFELLFDGLGVKVQFPGDAEARTFNPKEVVYVDDEDKAYDPVETLDALADIIVVAKGSGIQLGLPVDEAVLKEVGPSNMSKLDSDGNVIVDEDGKIQKGPDYFRPNLPRLLEELS